MLEERQLRGIVRMLKSIQERVERMLDERGEEAEAGIGVRQYNAIVEHLVDSDEIPDGLFIILEPGASAGDVDICCIQLAGYLEGSMEDSEGKKNGKNEIGELIREAMPDWVKKQVVAKAAILPAKRKAEMDELESQMSELGKQMQDLAQQMGEEDASGEDRMKELAEQMRQLGQQQAELAKRFASFPPSKAEE